METTFSKSSVRVQIWLLACLGVRSEHWMARLRLTRTHRARANWNAGTPMNLLRGFIVSANCRAGYATAY
eukprot:scaffold142493_cov112-Phaeocystis_antarctica.AAC.1